VRRIPLVSAPTTRLYSIDKSKGKSAADEILEFCKVPRTRAEICGLLDMTAYHWVRRGYLNPLIESGRLKKTTPDTPQSPDCRFVTAEYATAAIASSEGLLEFCKTPRRKRDIFLHFGLSAFQMKSIFDPLIADGRLICTDPTNPRNHWQKFVTADSDEATVTPTQVEKFCIEPRTREELAKFLGLPLETIRKRLDFYIAKGIIKMTKPDTPRSIDQRFISATATGTAVLSAEEVQAFCAIPRGRKEIADHFNLLVHNARNYIDKLVIDGKLKMTIPQSPSAKQQKFVKADVDMIIFTEDALIEFCRTPRTKGEITEHFCLTTKMSLSNYLFPLIDAGKINRTRPIGSIYQKFVSA